MVVRFVLNSLIKIKAGCNLQDSRFKSCAFVIIVFEKNKSKKTINKWIIANALSNIKQSNGLLSCTKTKYTVCKMSCRSIFYVIYMVAYWLQTQHKQMIKSAIFY